MPTDPPATHSPSADPERRLFDEALDLPAGPEREAWLAGACGGDEALRVRILALLRAHEEETHFLPESLPAIANAPSEQPGERIGRYKLLQEIGEGGFGSVWMAEQVEPVTRRVALKIIKLGMDTREVIARFEAERQALAMMDHPNIAKVLDAGATDKGRPFFVMELVKGVTITKYCDEAGLTTRERLGLFGDVCSAINHAHQKGIIHRDIKPSNVMVTMHGDRPVVKVIDFGIAKATQGKLTDKTLFTRFEQFIGTPVYMSPEQAATSGLDIDTRSDIYALGILLYEMLVGKPPFDAKSLASAGHEEMRRIIREVEPPKPSSRLSTVVGEERTLLAKAYRIEPEKLRRLVEPDLDWIVMKAIDKDRARRYETANAFAQDIVRFLSGQPVIATPPSAGYQFSKFIRRNKLAFTAGAAIAASLVIGIAVSAWQAVIATRAKKEAVTAFDELRATAPAFAEQARGLAAKEQYADAIAKLDYAIKLRPGAAEFLVAKGDLLQCQLQLAPAAAIYHEALRVQPDLARAGASAKLCEELLAAPPATDGKLSRESLAKLHLAMQKQQRPAAELLPVARLLGEEKKLLLDYWLARLKDLPVSPENPLAKRLTVREDGRLALDLSDTKVTGLSPLAGAPLAALDLDGSTELTDLSPLAGLNLIELQLDRTAVTDLTPLREMHSLEFLTANETEVADLTPLSALRLKSLHLMDARVTDLTPLQKMPLEELNLSGMRVADLSPLSGMPIKKLWLDHTPVRDFSQLARMPLEKCYLGGSQITDLTVLRGRPLKELVLTGCERARNYAALAEIPTLEALLLPSTFHMLPPEDIAAIGALRTHPRLRQIQADIQGKLYYSTIQSKDLFWQDWDRLQTFLPALHKSAIQFNLHMEPDGSYGLSITDNVLTDISMLKGAPISRLNLPHHRITDLTPLRGMPLISLRLDDNPVTDLSPLRGMPLEQLRLNTTLVSDLSPLVGLPLKLLLMADCPNLTDISPLLQIPTLEDLVVGKAARNVELLRKMPNLKNLDFKCAVGGFLTVACTAQDFWKKWEGLTWERALQAAGINHTVTEFTEETPEGEKPTGMWAVTVASKDFSDCSIFQGAENIRELRVGSTAVTDLAPLKGMPLKDLWIHQTQVTDLSPLKGMKLDGLHLGSTPVSDLSPLRGMPLARLSLHDCQQVTDVSPLADCRELQELVLPPNAKNIESLRAHPKLERLSFHEDPKKGSAEFWKDYDTAKK